MEITKASYKDRRKTPCETHTPLVRELFENKVILISQKYDIIKFFIFYMTLVISLSQIFLKIREKVSFQDKKKDENCSNNSKLDNF